MEQNKNSAFIFFIVLIVISLSLAGGAYYFLTQAKKKNLELDQQIQELTAQHSATLMELDNSKAKINSLQSSITEAEMKLESVKLTLDKEKTAKDQAIAQLSQIRSDLAKEVNIKGELEKKLISSETALKDMEARVNEMDGQLKTLESQRSDLEQKVKKFENKFGNVELGTIVVNPEATVKKPVVAKLEGRVLVVNKDYNFAVINLGTKDKVTAGSIFTVFHNNKNVGELRVEKVHEAMSAAGFGSEAVKEKISEGDRVESKN